MIDLSDYSLEEIENIHYALQLRIDDLLHLCNSYSDIIDTLQNFDDVLTDYIEEIEL